MQTFLKVYNRCIIKKVTNGTLFVTVKVVIPTERLSIKSQPPKQKTVTFGKQNLNEEKKHSKGDG